jgi:hypothetical protein
VGRALLVRDGNLTVEHQLSAKGGDIVERCAEQLASIIAVAAEKPENSLPIDDCNKAMAVMFDPMKPAVTSRRLGGRAYDLQSDMFGERCL